MGQTVFITGTGAATARLFAAHGWQVAATVRHPADVMQMMKQNFMGDK